MCLFRSYFELFILVNSNILAGHWSEGTSDELSVFFSISKGFFSAFQYLNSTFLLDLKI